MKQTIIIFTLVLLTISVLDTSAQTSRRRIVKHSYHNQSNNISAHNRKSSNTNISRNKNNEKRDTKKEDQANEMFLRAKHLYNTDHYEEAEELFKSYLQTGYEHYYALSKYYLNNSSASS